MKLFRRGLMHSNRPCVNCGLPSNGHTIVDGKQRCVSGGPPRFYKPAFGSAFDDVPQISPPDLGDPSLSWPALLTEPEINTIHACLGFLQEACKVQVPILQAWWKHYGPTLDQLSKRIAAETEGPNAKPPVKQNAVSSTDNSIFPDSE